MLVFAFDRDWTVDVNPHPDKEAVALSWIRQVAHETEHEVYAIGNQRLVEEAEIPGVMDIVNQHSDPREEWLGEMLQNGRYERFPSRKERLAMIEDLHPGAEEYIVVDDIDLSDVDGWTHYYAWEFVPAVESGDIDASLPGVQNCVADGGLQETAGISPEDASELASFLDDHGYGYELTYTAKGVERTQVLHDMSLNAMTVERPAAAPTVQCTPVTPTTEPFTVRVDAIQRVSVVDPPQMLYTAEAETVKEKATGLRRLAEIDPEAVSISAILGLLDREAQVQPWNQDAFRALRLVAQATPEECAPAIPILRSLLREEQIKSPGDALITLRVIGGEDPAEIVPATDAIVPYLDSNLQTVRIAATRCIASIAETFPEDAVDAVPLLAATVEDDVAGSDYAVYALSQITHEYPEEVKPVAATLSDVILDETKDDGVRLNATAALGRICREYPDTGIGIVDDMVTLLDAENPKLRNNAIALISDIAIVHTDVVEPYVDDLSELVSADDDYTRINASGALARVARDFPESIEPFSETFIELLSDDESLVRVNACWALGHLEAAKAVPVLEERLADDEDSDVRKRADWAIHKIQ